MEHLYFGLCRALGVAEIWLAFRLWRGDLRGYRLTLFAFLVADAASNLIPIHLRDPLWWRFIWMPLCFLRIGLMAIESFEIVRIPFRLLRKTQERLYLSYATLGSAVIVLSAWTWNPENRFQQLDAVSQYARMVILVAFLICWIWACLNAGAWPLASSGKVRHAGLWSLWLLSAFVTSTKAKSGLLWLFFEWRGGYPIWLKVGIACLAAQLILVFMFSENERSK